jgi:hypothetical protein
MTCRAAIARERNSGDCARAEPESGSAIKQCKESAVTTTFLHEDKPLAPDQLGAEKPPICSWCGTEMWLLSVDKVITDTGIEGTYRFECKLCGSVQAVHRHDDITNVAIAPEGP